ncbi:LytTR family DNA-binding domain-containing protein [Limibacter armeniacum]|uniref:LytR/AlgR family response regulator transcription factor n=1 Tax=Limibacter armeniacum TaxID=466084 RepID=UPI002FE6AC91
MKIKCLIVDDEPLAIQVLENYLARLNEFEVVGTCENPVDAFSILQQQSVDLLFLDINMPMLSGIELLKTLEKAPEVIITTAYRDFALEGFELSVLDYMLKPVSFQRFLKGVNKASKIIQLNQLAKNNSKQNVPAPSVSSGPATTEKPHVFLKVDKKMVKVYLDDILYIESLKDYIRIFTTEEELIVHHTLSKIVEMLPTDQFIRIHRSFAVAVRKVEAIEGNQIEIHGKQLPIGRLYQQSVKDTIYGNHTIG